MRKILSVFIVLLLLLCLPLSANAATMLTLESVTLGEVTGDTLPVTFRAEGGPNGQVLQYEISVTAGDSSGMKTLLTGTTTAGADTVVSLDLQGLSSYSDYRLVVRVYYLDEGMEFYDTLQSDPFAYTNPAADTYQPEFSVTVRPDENLVFVDWTDTERRAESILIALFEDGAEPFFDTYDPNDEGVQLSFTPGTKVLEVEMSAKVNGISTTPVRKKINIADMALSCPADKTVNYINYPITYTDIGDVQIDVTLGEETASYQLSGSGILNIFISDGWNELTVQYTDSQGVHWQIARELFTDRIPPVLSMSQKYDGMTVKGNKVTVSGAVIDGQTVTINDEAVELSADGLFSKELTLVAGENVVRVSAKDGLGNETLYAAKIYSGESAQNAAQDNGQDTQSDTPGSFLTQLLAPGNYWVLLASGIVAVLVIGYGLIFWRKEKKDENI